MGYASVYNLGCQDPLSERAPDALYETRSIVKEPVVTTPTSDNTVEVMSLQDYNPNVPHIDADQYAEEQRIMREIALHAEARFASFMDNCRQLREGDRNCAAAIDKFTERLVELYLNGRPPLASTEQHRALMNLVLKATLANLVSSPD